MSAVTAESLVQLLERFGDSVLLLDCRSPGASHEAVSIRGAARVVLPSIVERRSKGTVPLGCLVLKPDVRQALSTGSFRAVIVYDQSSRTVDGTDDGGKVLRIILRTLSEKIPAINVHFLMGGYANFYSKFSQFCTFNFDPSLPKKPENCQTMTSLLDNPIRSSEESLMMETTAGSTVASGCFELNSFRLQSFSGSVECCNEEPAKVQEKATDTVRLHLDKDRGNPVEVMPWLFLGNSFHASRKKRLLDIGITAIVNAAACGHDDSTVNVGTRCTEASSSSPVVISTLDLPIQDDSTCDISQWFLVAIKFIDNIRQMAGRVLVHCNAGISRSATLCIAYVMHHSGLTLDQAHDFLKSKRSLISPNLNFMRQLSEFEKTLNDRRCQLLSTDCRDEPVIENRLSPRNRYSTWYGYRFESARYKKQELKSRTDENKASSVHTNIEDDVLNGIDSRRSGVKEKAYVKQSGMKICQRIFVSKSKYVNNSLTDSKLKTLANIVPAIQSDNWNTEKLQFNDWTVDKAVWANEPPSFGFHPTSNYLSVFSIPTTNFLIEPSNKKRIKSASDAVQSLSNLTPIETTDKFRVISSPTLYRPASFGTSSIGE